jgi:hypothetical protein
MATKGTIAPVIVRRVLADDAQAAVFGATLGP